MLLNKLKMLIYFTINFKLLLKFKKYIIIFKIYIFNIN